MSHRGTFESATLILDRMDQFSFKQSLRQSYLLQRKQLTAERQQEKALELIKTIAPLAEFLKSQHIAAYWPIQSEINPLPLIELALKMKKSCYLPALDPLNEAQLCFVQYRPGDRLVLNRFGILEPIPTLKNVIATSLLELVWVPVVAFDAKGQRLGMGGGHYDRSFSFLKQSPKPLGPHLLGIAYEMQQVEALPVDSWDVPLDAIATEKRYISVKS